MYTEYVIKPLTMNRGRKCYLLSRIVAGSFTFGYTSSPVGRFKTIDAARGHAFEMSANAIVHESY